MKTEPILIPEEFEDLDPQTSTVAVARQYAAGIAYRSDRPEMLRVAASLRIIAAAMEDYPDFFAKDRA